MRKIFNPLTLYQLTVIFLLVVIIYNLKQSGNNMIINTVLAQISSQLVQITKMPETPIDWIAFASAVATVIMAFIMLKTVFIMQSQTKQAKTDIAISHHKEVIQAYRGAIDSCYNYIKSFAEQNQMEIDEVIDSNDPEERTAIIHSFEDLLICRSIPGFLEWTPKYNISESLKNHEEYLALVSKLTNYKLDACIVLEKLNSIKQLEKQLS